MCSQGGQAHSTFDAPRFRREILPHIGGASGERRKEPLKCDNINQRCYPGLSNSRSMNFVDEDWQTVMYVLKVHVMNPSMRFNVRSLCLCLDIGMLYALYTVQVQMILRVHIFWRYFCMSVLVQRWVRDLSSKCMCMTFCVLLLRVPSNPLVFPNPNPIEEDRERGTYSPPRTP